MLNSHLDRRCVLSSLVAAFVIVFSLLLLGEILHSNAIFEVGMGSGNFLFQVAFGSPSHGSGAIWLLTSIVLSWLIYFALILAVRLFAREIRRTSK